MKIYQVKNFMRPAVSKTIPLSSENHELVALISKTKAHLPSAPMKLSPKSLLTALPNGRPSVASCGIAGIFTSNNIISAPIQMRHAHTDVTNVPDFSAYRVDSTKSPTARSNETDINRKTFLYTTMFTGAIMATVAAKYTVKTLLMPLGPTAKTLAEASIEVNLSEIPEGKCAVFKWRNKPLFVRHRSEQDAKREEMFDATQLRDPERDEDRVQKREWLICLGICTHLGCVPIPDAGDFPGGYYCPCHGSHYDGSGRIRRGPAPANLEIPEYKFIDDSTVLVG